MYFHKPTWDKPGIGSKDAACILGLHPFQNLNDIIMRIARLSQDTPEWLSWRRKGIGASESATALGMNPFESADDLLAVKTGQKPEFDGNEHTARGKAREPGVRQWYESLMQWQMPPVCGIHDKHDFIRASLDGLRADGKLVLEIKCPTPRWHKHSLQNGPPDWYLCQMQHQMLVSGAKMAHFVSYCPEWTTPGESYYLSSVKADPEFQVYLEDELVKFWQKVQEVLNCSHT